MKYEIIMGLVFAFATYLKREKITFSAVWPLAILFLLGGIYVG